MSESEADTCLHPVRGNRDLLHGLHQSCCEHQDRTQGEGGGQSLRLSGVKATCHTAKAIVGGAGEESASSLRRGGEKATSSGNHHDEGKVTANGTSRGEGEAVSASR